MATQPAKPKGGGAFKPWMAYVGGGVILVYFFFVRRASQQSAAASASQQAYPVVAGSPNNTEAAGIGALLTLLTSGGAPVGGKTLVSQGASNQPPGFFPISAADAAAMIKRGGTPYYSPAAGQYIPVTDLTSVHGAQLFGSTLLTQVPAGTTLGTKP